MSNKEATQGPRRIRYLERCPRVLGNGLPPLEFGSGWDDLVIELLEGFDRLLTDEEAQALDLMQIKEKFGLLRIYFTLRGVRPNPQWPGSTSPRDEALRALVQQAVEKSERTCMACGAPGQMRTNGWMRVSCDRCDGRWKDMVLGDGT